MIAHSKPPNRKRPGPPRKGRLRDPKYLEWIRAQSCACCEITPGGAWMGIVEAAHVGVRGISHKSSDHTCIPLCGWHHTRSAKSAHFLGKHFWKFWHFDRETLIAKCRAAYLAEFPERAV